MRLSRALWLKILTYCQTEDLIILYQIPELRIIIDVYYAQFTVRKRTSSFHQFNGYLSLISEGTFPLVRVRLDDRYQCYSVKFKRRDFLLFITNYNCFLVYWLNKSSYLKVINNYRKVVSFSSYDGVGINIIYQGQSRMGAHLCLDEREMIGIVQDWGCL